MEIRDYLISPKNFSEISKVRGANALNGPTENL